MKVVRIGLVAAISLSGLGSSSGCWWNKDKGTAIGPGAFYRPQITQAPQQRRDPLDTSTPPLYDNVRFDLLEPGQRRQPTAQTPSVTALSPAVKEAVQFPGAPAAPAAAAGPATAPSAFDAGPTSAQYMTLGAVVTEVSGTPIYADKVLSALTPLLSTEARQKEQGAFQLLAKREIEKQVNLMIRTELEYAAAVRNLDQQEKTLAENLTMQWRMRQITEAGGSLELARRKAQAEYGMDFDERVRERHREFMVQIFYQKKVYPKVQVTADDMRKYYDKNVRTLFTESDQAQFRVIKIEAKKMGGRAEALDKIKDLHDRAARGEDFAKLAGSINHDPVLMKSAGLVGGGDGWVQRGAYANQKVEEAVWKLVPGQVTEVIEEGDSYYIAKLENRKLGRVKSFEEEEVQQQILDTLRKEQVAVKREQVQEKLMKDAVIYPYPPVTEPVLEMAMQKYGGWK